MSEVQSFLLHRTRVRRQFYEVWCKQILLFVRLNTFSYKTCKSWVSFWMELIRSQTMTCLTWLSRYHVHPNFQNDTWARFNRFCFTGLVMELIRSQTMTCLTVLSRYNVHPNFHNDTWAKFNRFCFTGLVSDVISMQSAASRYYRLNTFSYKTCKSWVSFWIELIRSQTMTWLTWLSRYNVHPNFQNDTWARFNRFLLQWVTCNSSISFWMELLRSQITKFNRFCFNG